MRHRRRRPPISDINVVPYLDVLLVLLVIFMVTAPLFNQGVVDVPEVGDTALPGATEVGLEIEYEESSDSRYRLIDRKNNLESDGLTGKDLIDELEKKKILYDNDNPPIILAADSALSYGDVMDLLGKLHAAGYTNLALSAKQGSP